MVSYEYAVIIAIAGIVGATIFRTFLPLVTKVIAELQLAERENRDPVPPRFHWLWGVGAVANVALIGFPMFATLDTFVTKIIDVTSPFMGFFIVFAAANLSQEVIFRMMDSAIAPKVEPQPATSPGTDSAEPSG